MPNKSGCDFRNRSKEARQEKFLMRDALQFTIVRVMAIKSITHRGLKRLFETDDTRGIDSRSADKLRKMLFAIHEAECVSQTENFPGWRLHALTGDLAGFWSLRVTGNQRLIFRFEDGDAYDLNLLDYH